MAGLALILWGVLTLVLTVIGGIVTVAFLFGAYASDVFQSNMWPLWISAGFTLVCTVATITLFYLGVRS